MIQNPATPLCLTDEVAAFVQSGVSVIMGTIGPDGRACAGWGLGARVLPDGRVRILYPTEGNEAFTSSAEAGRAIATTFSAPLTYRTLQLKAATSRAEVLEPEDRALLDGQLGTFAQVLDTLLYPPRFVEAFCQDRATLVSVFSFVPEAAFEQTPGPGAGRAL